MVAELGRADEVPHTAGDRREVDDIAGGEVGDQVGRGIADAAVAGRREHEGVVSRPAAGGPAPAPPWGVPPPPPPNRASAPPPPISTSSPVQPETMLLPASPV